MTANPPRPKADSPASPTRSPLAVAPRPGDLGLIVTPGFADYQLLDSGKGRKLERFGRIVLDRPEAQALWSPRLPRSEWQKANAVFSASGEDDEKGRWRVDKPVPDSWPVQIDASADAGRRAAPVTMLCRLSGLWHLGLFPEQMPHWQWMHAALAEMAKRSPEPPRVLNLFGYTGAASLIAAAAGAHVTHVDASKKAVQWGRDNQAASKLLDKPVRWLIDDAKKFVAREVRRGKTYHLILIDPPKFGRGPEGETWDLFTDLPELLSGCASLLDRSDARLVLTVYAIRASTLAFRQLLAESLGDRSGTFETGELAISEAGAGVSSAKPRGGSSSAPEAPSKDNSRLVPTSLYTRWTSQQ